MTERLQKLISQAGLASRRQAENWIEQGRVQVNGRAARLGDKADPAVDIIEVDGRRIASSQQKITVLLNKPRGYISTLSDPEGRRLVTELVRDIPERLYPVGRLDFNTEGLLLLTNDGDLSLKLTHPRNHVPKTYLVKVRGALTPAIIEDLTGGILLDGYRTAPARVDNVRQNGGGAWFELTIHEGKNRQIRRMCEAVGLTVVRLKRIRMGFLDLHGVAPGRYRLLSPSEVSRLRKTK